MDPRMRAAMGNGAPRPMIAPPGNRRSRLSSRRARDIELHELVRQVVVDFDCAWHTHRDEMPCECSMARLGRFAREAGIVE